MKPGEWLGCTVDEVLLCYRGKIQDWRYHRAFTNLIHRSLVEKGVNIYEAIPIPFDDEILDNDSTDDLEAFYNEAVKEWQTIS